MGYPLAKYDRALAGPAFRFSDDFIDYFKRNVSPEREYSPTELNSIAEQYIMDTKQPIGIFESEDDFIKRSAWEIEESKRSLEDWLGHKVNHICWPGGAYNDTHIEQALNVGYLSCTVGSRFGGLNYRTDEPYIIRRISITKNIGIAKSLGAFGQYLNILFKLKSKENNKGWANSFISFVRKYLRKRF